MTAPRCVWLVIAGVAALALIGCSDDAGVPEPKTVELSDGASVWAIQEARCPDGADCGWGVYINRWYYGISCEAPLVDESALGPVFAVGDSYVKEARVINGQSPDTLALLLLGIPPDQPRTGACLGGDRWIVSTGVFDRSGLDDPPSALTQAPSTG